MFSILHLTDLWLIMMPGENWLRYMPPCKCETSLVNFFFPNTVGN